LGDQQNKVLADITDSANTLMTVNLHVAEKLFICCRMSKVDYQNKVLPVVFFCFFLSTCKQL